MKKELSNNKDAVRIREWRAAHPEEAKRKSREAARKRRKELGRDVVNAQAREQKKKWRELNPEAAREYHRQWRTKNRALSNQIQKNWRAKNPAYGKDWADKNREKIRAAGLAWYHRNRDKACLAAGWRNLTRHYGITREQYYQIIAVQGGGCGICGAVQGEHGKRFPVDHCHKTRLVRGVLCEDCNLLLGKIERRAGWLERMEAYIAAVPATKVITTHCDSEWKMRKKNVGPVGAQ